VLILYAVLFWVLLGGLVLTFSGFRNARRCPACSTEMIPLDEQPSDQRAYEILLCPSCPTVDTAVHGTRASPAFCPRCLQHTMSTKATLLTQKPGGPKVAVHETCHLCHHEADETYGQWAIPGARKKGVVLDFRHRNQGQGHPDD
jgi:hypothetical protein